MGYGSPASLEEVEEYYTHIRGGRKPTPEQLDDLVGRYKAIGGSSPLLRITESQAAGLQAALTSRGSDTKVYTGMKHSRPFISDVVEKASSEGASELLCLALAPHYSSISIGGYMRAVEEARARTTPRPEVSFVKSWHNEPGLVSLWAQRVVEAADGRRDASLVFSAHSLPERIISEGDPYRDQLLETSRLVAAKAGWKEWSFAFQSASETGEPWLGPDIIDQLENLYEEGERNFILAPLGFVSDHLEILYDIDVECKQWAEERKVSLARGKSPNDSKELLETLMSIVSEKGFA